MKMISNFIVTKDKTTAEYLENQGLKLISCLYGEWTFVNNADVKLTFDKSKVRFTNKLCM